LSERPDPVDSVYRRRIDVQPSATLITAELEDHHHYFQVELTLADDVIQAVTTNAVRSPWTTCADGAAAIRSLIGLSLDEADDPRSWAADRSLHCTHVGDLTLIAVRHGRDPRPLDYRVEIQPAARRRRTATVHCYGEEVMRWDMDAQTIVGPAPFDHLPLDRAAFLPWIRAHLSPGAVEAAMVLRRASSIALGNAFDLDSCSVASDAHGADDTCHTYRAAVVLTARRNVGSSRALTWQ
jgi:hypothetical protein